jgi:IS1 family transposase
MKQLYTMSEKTRTQKWMGNARERQRQALVRYVFGRAKDWSAESQLGRVVCCIADGWYFGVGGIN